MTDPETTRRHLLTGLAAAGVALPVLAACGDDGDDEAGGTGSSTPSGTASSPPPSPDQAAEGGLKTADVPVGGGTILDDEGVVVTQPKAGEFKAFSSTCTHMGCAVAEVKDGTINCPCHGSKYSVADGSVKSGPAPRGLPERTVTVTGDTLTVA